MAGVPITDVDSFDTALSANPAEPPSAANVLSFLQSHANRDRYVYERSGARTSATITALRAVTGMTDGHVRTVPGYGRFIYQAAALPDAPPTVVVATAGGCWVRDDASARSRRLPTPANAVHRWKLGETSGNFLNIVSAGQDMVPHASLPRAQRAPIGRGISGLGGSGVGAVATADAVAAPLTISCWVILGTPGSIARLVARPRTGYTDCTWRLDIDADGKLSGGVRIAGAGAETAVLGAAALPQGVPLYLALVYDDNDPDLPGTTGSLKIYANGVPQSVVGAPALGGLDHGAGTTVCVAGGDGSSSLRANILEDVLIEQALVTGDELRDRYLRGIGLVEEG